MFEELGKIQLVDVVLPTRHGPDIRRRCVTQPTEHQAILLARLKLNPPTLPLTRIIHKQRICSVILSAAKNLGGLAAMEILRCAQNDICE